MRGFLEPALRQTPNELQSAYSEMSRGRRAKIAAAAQTDLVKASQWARGDGVQAEVASALEAQLKAHLAKKKA
jgi:hypothetical protein